MLLVSGDERERFFQTFQWEAIHLEMRDSYGTAVERPHLNRWEAGEPDDDLEWLQPWFSTVREGRQAGKVFRRARIISEPVTDYIRWEHMDTHLFVEAGEDIRWLPRRSVSGIALPGNDFCMFDSETVIFSVFAGGGLVVERQLTTDPGIVELCKAAFESVWVLAIPHSEYQLA